MAAASSPLLAVDVAAAVGYACVMRAIAEFIRDLPQARLRIGAELLAEIERCAAAASDPGGT
jgi:hypothetical protein